MPRIRTIKPSFFQSEDVSALPMRARLTWIGLWTHCDDHGRTKDNVKLIKANVWALDDVTLRDVEDDLETLAAHGRIVRYEVDGERYLAIVNWHDHQSIQKKQESKIPPPPSTGTGSPQSYSCSTTGAVPEHYSSGTGGKGREGKGKERRAPNGAQRAPARASPAELTEQAHTTTARRYVDAYADRCQQRPVASVLRKLSSAVQELVDEDWPDQLITSALANWGDKGLDPKALPSVANEVANRALGRGRDDTKPSKDDKVRALQQLKTPPLHAIEGGSSL